MRLKKINLSHYEDLIADFFLKFWQVPFIVIVSVCTRFLLNILKNRKFELFLFLAVIIFLIPVNHTTFISEKSSFRASTLAIAKPSHRVKSTNLVKNGDFSQGMLNFSSDLIPNSIFKHLTSYEVLDNPRLVFKSAPPCKDHTNDSESKMLAVNSGENPFAAFWRQTISDLESDTDYHFSVWVANVCVESPVRLRLVILSNNVKLASSPPYTPSVICNWEQVSLLWNSGKNTTITLELRDDNIDFIGNDFAIDDISFVKR